MALQTIYTIDQYATVREYDVASGTSQPLFLQGIERGTAITVVGDKVIFATTRIPRSARIRSILRASPESGVQETVYTSVVTDIVADGQGRIYWSEPENDAVVRVSSLSDTVSRYDVFRDLGRNPQITAMALDSTDQLFVVDSSLQQIQRLSLDPVSVEAVVRIPRPENTADDVDMITNRRMPDLGVAQFFPEGGLSIIGNRLYWIDRADFVSPSVGEPYMPQTGATLRSAKKADGSDDRFEIDRGLESPRGLVAADSKIFYTEGDKVMEYDPSNGAWRTVFRVPFAELVDLHVITS